MRKRYQFLIFTSALLVLMEMSWGFSIWLEAGRWPGADLSELPPYTHAQESELRTHPVADHLAAVAASGYAPVADDAAVETLLADRRLRRIDTGLVGLRGVSRPYLRPDAYFELDQIGQLFRERLRDMGIGGGKVVVASALRTVRSLPESGSGDAAETLFASGLTFDLHCERFGPETRGNEPGVPWRRWWWSERERRRRPEDAERLRGLLASILIREQHAGRILATHEKGSPVFRVTVKAARD